MEHNFQPGSRGFVIRRLQTALGITADGIYGRRTTAAIRQLQDQAQNATDQQNSANKPAPFGHAGPAEFQLLDLPWPSDFERAINLVCCFEGTEFGDCNSRDIDGAGLTLGIAGFTTAHGEVQELIARYVAAQPACLEALPDAVQSQLIALLARRNMPAVHWRRLMFGADGRVLPHWHAAFARWGACPVMQALQLEMTYKRFWEPALATSQSMGFSTLRADTFFLDVAVQNGGWRNAHLLLAKRMSDWHSRDEQQALTVAARAVAACAREKWRNDVLSRKMAIATGQGVVHGCMWIMEKFAV